MIAMDSVFRAQFKPVGTVNESIYFDTFPSLCEKKINDVLLFRDSYCLIIIIFNTHPVFYIL